MVLTRTLTKKNLESLVSETFLQFGNLSSSSLLDSLKLLGFYYATVAGISINIEDLKTPDVKKTFLKNANEEVNLVSLQWQQGLISDTERFQSIMNTWNVATEALKNRIIDYYQNFDPTNNLYIMAFSGARGNMSQVRQLVGMRGLMSDQEGKIIDLPIQTNFREGLSSIDYIISSYGARKGIVDTALKTADSGYLTRRLIYIAQDLVIREPNCGTKKGILFLLHQKSDIKNLLGRSLISIQSSKKFSFLVDNSNLLLTESFLNSLKKKENSLILNVRSSLTCDSNNSICQKCYGWDLSQNQLIGLGEAIGIIAGQSIGEPGTQLTMRTFHTGGIFTGEMSNQILAPFSGKLFIPKFLKTLYSRTNRGQLVLKLQQELSLKLQNWKGLKETISLNVGSSLYLSSTGFVKKGQLIAESSLHSLNSGKRRLKPIYTLLAGEIKYENIIVRTLSYNNRTLKINQENGVIWITSGKVLIVPKEIEYQFQKNLNDKKSFGKLKIITPFSGFIQSSNNFIRIVKNDQILELDLTSILPKVQNCSIKISLFFQNYQYVDAHTVVGILEFYPSEKGIIYSIRKKVSTHFQVLFFILESDIWRLHSDEITNFSYLRNKPTYIRSGNFLNLTTQFSRSGFFLKKDGFNFVFQKAIPIYLTQGTILNYKQGDFVLEKKIFATLRISTQQTEDIVQGLPKIEELIEARKPKKKACLALKPGIFLDFYPEENTFLKELNVIFTNKGIFKVGKEIENSEKPFLSKTEKRNIQAKLAKRKRKHQICLFCQSIWFKKTLILYNQKPFHLIPIPNFFKLSKKDNTKTDKKKSNNKYFQFDRRDDVSIFGRKKPSSWIKVENVQKQTNEIFIAKFFKFQEGKVFPWLKIKKNKNDFLFKNQKNDYLVKRSDGSFFLLESVRPLSEYKMNSSSTILYKPGTFVDIGEPLTEGLIDAHDLLNILFKYHSFLDGMAKGTEKSLTKFQLLFTNSIQSIYQSQGVNIASKHVEIIVKQMTAKVLIKESGDTPFLPGELIRFSLVKEICKILEFNESTHKLPKYEPILLATTKASLSKDGFLSAAGFQETKRVLTKAAIEGSLDWLRGLKECIIIGRLIPAGSTFLNYKSYLDSIHLFKTKKENSLKD